MFRRLPSRKAVASDFITSEKRRYLQDFSELQELADVPVGMHPFKDCPEFKKMSPPDLDDSKKGDRFDFHVPISANIFGPPADNFTYEIYDFIQEVLGNKNRGGLLQEQEPEQLELIKLSNKRKIEEVDSESDAAVFTPKRR